MNQIIFCNANNPKKSSTLTVNDGMTWQSFTSDLCDQLELTNITALQLHNSLDEMVGTTISTMEDYFNVIKLWENGMIFKVFGDSANFIENTSPIVNFQEAITKDFAFSIQSIVAGLSRLESSETESPNSIRQSMASLKTSAEMELERQKDEELKKRIQAEEDSRRLREMLDAEKRQQTHDYNSKSSPIKGKKTLTGLKHRSGGYADAVDEDYPPLSYSTDEDMNLQGRIPINHSSAPPSENGDSHLSSSYDDDEDQEWTRAEEQRAKHKAREVERQKRVQMIATQRRTLEEGNGKQTNQLFGSTESAHHVGGSRLRAMGGVKLLMKKPIEIAFKSFQDPKGELVNVSVDDQCDWIALTTAVGVYLNIEPTQITHFVLIDEDGDEASGKVGDSTKFWKFFDRYRSVDGRSFAVHFTPQEVNSNTRRDSFGSQSQYNSPETMDAPSLLTLPQKKTSKSNQSSSHPTLPPKSQQQKTESYHFRLSTDYIDERVLIPIPADCNWKVLTDNLLSHLNIPKGSRDSTQITRISLFDEDGDEIAGPFENEDKFWKAARSRYGGTTVFVAAIETSIIETTSSSHTTNSKKESSSRARTSATAPPSSSSSSSSPSSPAATIEVYFSLSPESARESLNIPKECSWQQLNDLVMTHFKLVGKAILNLILYDEEDEVFGGIQDERKFWKSIKSFYKPKEMKYIVTLKDAPVVIPTISILCRLSSESKSKSMTLPLNGTWEQINQAIIVEYALSNQEIDFIELIDSDGDVFGSFHSEVKFWKSVKTTFATQSDLVYVVTTKSSKMTNKSKTTPVAVVAAVPTQEIKFRLFTEQETQQSSIPIPINGTWQDISQAVINHYSSLPSNSTLLHLDFKDLDGDDIIKKITSDKKFWKAVKISQTAEGIFVATVEIGTEPVVKQNTSKREQKTLSVPSSPPEEQMPSTSFTFTLSNSSVKKDIDIPNEATWEAIESIVLSKLKVSNHEIDSITLFDEDNDALFENITTSSKFWKVVHSRYKQGKGMYFSISAIATSNSNSKSKKTKDNDSHNKSSPSAAVAPAPAPPVPTTPYHFRLMSEEDTVSHEIEIPISGDWKQISNALIESFNLPNHCTIDQIDLIDQDGDVISADISNEKKFWKIAKKGYSDTTVFVITYSASPLEVTRPTIPIFCRLSTDNIDDKAVATIPEDGTWEDIADSILHSLGTSHEDDLDHLDLIDTEGDEIFGMINTDKKFWKAFKHRYNSTQMIFVATLQYNSTSTAYQEPIPQLPAVPTLPYSFSLTPELTDILSVEIPEEGSWDAIIDAIAAGLHLNPTEVVSSLQLIDLDGDDVFSKIIDAKKFWKAALSKYVANETVFLVHCEAATSPSSNVFIPSAISTNDLPIPQVSIYKKKVTQPSPTTTSYQSSISDLDSSTRSHGSDPYSYPPPPPSSHSNVATTSAAPAPVSIYKKKPSSGQSTPQFDPIRNGSTSNTTATQDPKYVGRFVSVDCKLSTEGLDKIIVIAMPAMGTWEQIIETISQSYNLPTNTTVDRMDLLDNDDVPIASNIVSSTKFWKVCLEQYQESETYFNLTLQTISNTSKNTMKTPSLPSPLPSATAGVATTAALSPGRGSSDVANFLASCGDGDLDAVVDYLQRGYDVNLKDDSNLTGLHIACINGHYNIVQLLVDKEASITCRDLDGMTPLHFACENNHTQIAIYLVRMGADTSLRNRSGLTSLHYICLCGNMQLTVLIRDYLINVATSTGLTLLHCVADQGHVNLMKYLIEHDAQISPRDDEGLTPLHLSVINGHLDCVQLLLESGAYWNIRDDKGMSPVLHACHEGNLEMVTYLINPNIRGNIFARNDNGETALHLAVQSGSLELMKLLLLKKIEINGRNKRGETALDVAIQLGMDHVVTWLRDRGGSNKVESREEATTREKVDNKTETAARAYEVEEMLNLQRELEVAKGKKKR